VSGFAARPAEIWLPPSWVADPTPTLPVLELITGAPGAPADWTREAYADQTARLFAQDHGGTAPLIVMPDPNGSEFNDTECVDSPRGRSETYLTVDVLAFVATEFQAKVTARSVALVGLSAGGSCAVMLALRHPDLYTAFADFSGLTGPTVGESVDPTATTQTLFDGSREAYDAHDPLHLLRVAQYPTLAAWFDVGSSDPEPLAAQRELVPLALAAGITTCAHEEPGGHDGDFWTGAFRRALPWLSGRLGVTPPIGCG
jgi:S-formylglutathione hydrolase FrmB